MRSKGQQGEQRAQKFLTDQGYRILVHNYYCYQGEIDLIAMDDNFIVFVEVKQRGSGSYVKPEEAITRTKKRRLLHCAKKWIMDNNYRGAMRFDVIAIDQGKLVHYKNAFPAEE